MVKCKMKAPRVNNINKPVFLSPKKDYLFDVIPIYFFPQYGSSVMGIDFVFDIDSRVLRTSSSLEISAVNSFLTCGTHSVDEVEINSIIDSFGGYFSKSYNRRHFECSLHILSSSISKVMPIISDCIFKPIFPEEIIKKKLENKKKLFTISSMRVTEKAKVKFKELLYADNHPFGKKTHVKDFDILSSEALKKTHSRICNFQINNEKKLINNFSVLISGDYPKNIKKILENNFPSSFQNTQFQELKIIEKTNASCFYICQENALQTAFRVGRVLPGHSHKDFFGLKILITILGGYFGSRLMANIREEKGYTYGVGAFLITEEFYSEFNIVTEVGSQYTKQVFQEIVKEINILKNSCISISELNRVKSYMLGSILHNCNGLFSQVSVFKDLKKHNSSFNFLEKLNFEINNISPEKIKYLANKYFNISDIFFVACGPPQEKIW
tara:strand:+ start:636 stop:1958 length:1323 start_codon:yes stop_codon:yes gene_type:complete